MASARDTLAQPQREAQPQGGLWDVRPGHPVVHDPQVLHPHPLYMALCGPIAAIRAQRVAAEDGPIREPLTITADGTILDGHARWQVALDRQQPSLSCLEHDVTDEEALQIVIQQHRASEGLNAFCRIVMALELEPFLRERSPRSRPATALSSNLTNAEHRDVRKAIASVAGVATGNVTKVKQLLGTVVPEVRERLVRGEVRIHRAWQWRTLGPKAQRDALWEHLHRGAIKTTIARLVRAHADAGAAARFPDGAATVLGGLARLDANDITVAVLEVPGRAVVVTRACFDDLREETTR